MGLVYVVKGYVVWFCYLKWWSEEIEISLKMFRLKFNDNDYVDLFVLFYYVKIFFFGMWFCFSYFEYIFINFEVFFLMFDFYFCLLCGCDFIKIILFVGY